ncbi:hypothetical protein C6P40_000571 [Pichia californica]|uniref:Prefoldin subunit 4 n=1 Tax=Pichia californica TaxID=460514 RepID=A0A9P6WKM1_9ASCO|nr:hypothetical protein C6P40_000571 [[Candida] californica]
MELLPQGTQNNSHVTFEDQQKINEFSTLMTHFDRLNNQLNSLESDKEQIDDVTLELELVDEDELVDFLIGGETPESNIENNNFIGDGCFVKLKQKIVMKKLEFQSKQIDLKIDSIKSELDILNKTLSTLKTTLYAKFGNAINLER